MHSYTQKRRKMRKKRRNALKSLKTHLQPFGRRNECSDVLRESQGVPIYRITRRKLEKTSLTFSCATIPRVRAGRLPKLHAKLPRQVLQYVPSCTVLAVAECAPCVRAGCSPLCHARQPCTTSENHLPH